MDFLLCGMVDTMMLDVPDLSITMCHILCRHSLCITFGDHILYEGFIVSKKDNVFKVSSLDAKHVAPRFSNCLVTSEKESSHASLIMPINKFDRVCHQFH